MKISVYFQLCMSTKTIQWLSKNGDSKHCAWHFIASERIRAEYICERFNTLHRRSGTNTCDKVQKLITLFANIDSNGSEM